MNAGSIVGVPWGSGVTQTLLYAKELIWTYCTQRQRVSKNFGRKQSHMVKLSLPNITIKAFQNIV